MVVFLVLVGIGIAFFIFQKKANQNFAEAENKCREVYKSAILGNEEKITVDLTDIQSSFKLTSAKLNELSLKAQKSAILHTVQVLSDHNTLSPLNYDEVIKITNRLQLNAQAIPEIYSQINKMLKYWKIENEELAVQSVNINLQKGEECYYSSSTSWYENRTTTRTTSYSGFSTSIKIAKGVRYRIGSVTPHRVSHTTLTLIDSGRLYVTNKRIIFVGQKKNTNIRHSSILSIVPYSDGIGIQKDSGKSPVLSCNEADILARILVKAISPMSDTKDDLIID